MRNIIITWLQHFMFHFRLYMGEEDSAGQGDGKTVGWIIDGYFTSYSRFTNTTLALK